MLWLALQRLSSSNREHCEQAILALGASRDIRQIPSLVEILNTDDVVQQRLVKNALREFGAEAVPALIQCLTHFNKDFRLVAAEVLWDIGDPSGRDALITAALELTKDSDRKVRSRSAELLGNAGNANDDRISVALIRLLKDTDSGVRKSRAVAIGRIGDPKAAQALTQLAMSSELFGARWRARRGLGLPSRGGCCTIGRGRHAR